LINEHTTAVRVAITLFNAQRQLLQTERDIRLARSEMAQDPGDELARRRWLEALGRREFALEALERLEGVIATSDEFNEELQKP
jgi:hypothetical protein